MATIDLTLYREKLEALRISLADDMTRMEDNSLADHAKTISIPTDKEELGSDNADQELTLTLLESDETLLDQIEAALHRLEDGCYGRCDECGEDIPTSRLDAIPYASECVRCAETR
jgi:DnaK suppressor protein